MAAGLNRVVLRHSPHSARRQPLDDMEVGSMDYTPGMFPTKRRLAKAMAWVIICAVAQIALVFGLLAAVAEIIKAVIK